jgi:hypothetical protein
VTLQVLEANRDARRFHERAGFVLWSINHFGTVPD